MLWNCMFELVEMGTQPCISIVRTTTTFLFSIRQLRVYSILQHAI